MITLIIAAPFKAIASTFGCFSHALQCCSKSMSKFELELDRSFQTVRLMEERFDFHGRKMYPNLFQVLGKLHTIESRDYSPSLVPLFVAFLWR